MTTRRDNSYWRTKHERILEAAFEEFGQCGFELASMDKIANIAAVSKVTVYNHFETKDKLFIACFNYFFEFTFKPFALDVSRHDLSKLVESIVKHLNVPQHLAMLRLLRTEQNRCHLLGIKRSVQDIYTQDLLSAIGKILPFSKTKSVAVSEVVFSLIQKKIDERVINFDATDFSSKKAAAQIMTTLVDAEIFPN